MYSRLSWALLVLVAMFSFAGAMRAETVSVSASYNFVPNLGSGDNAASTLTGRDTFIGGGGSTGCFWCMGAAFSPGQSINASLYYLDFGSFFTGRFKGMIIDPSTFSLGSTTLTAGSFTFPLFEKSGMFSIVVPASMGVIHGQFGGEPLLLNVLPGQLKLNFSFSPGGSGSPPEYFFENAQYLSTPEPGTRILLGSGLMGIVVTSLRGRFQAPRRENFRSIPPKGGPTERAF